MSNVKTIIDGGPAFPISLGPLDYNLGMSLRDYFAAKAPVYPFDSSVNLNDDVVDVVSKRDAKWRYAWADAMIAEREKGQP